MASPNVAPLSQRQFRFWYEYLTAAPDRRGYMHHTLVVPVDPSITTRDVQRALDVVVSRHDMLRTTFQVTESDGLVQRVDPAAASTLVVLDLSDPADLRDSSAAVVREFIWRPMDLRNDLPLRVAAIRVAGRLAEILLVVHHVAIDKHSISVLRTELAAMLQKASAPAIDLAAREPGVLADLVAAESSDSVATRRRRAREYLGKNLNRIPSVNFPYARSGDQGIQRVAEIKSSVLANALSRLSRSAGVPLSAVTLAALSVAVRAYTGGDVVVWESLVDNRPSTLPEHTVGCFMDFAFTIVDSGDARTFTEFAREVLSAILVAHRYSDCDYADLVEAEVHTTLARGAGSEGDMVYNFRLKGRPGTDLSDAPAVENPPSQIIWSERLDPALVFVSVHDRDDFTLSLAVRSAVVPEQDHRDIVATLERIVQRATHDADISVAHLIAETAPPHWPRQPDWTLVSRNRWVDLGAIRETFEGFPDVAAAHPAVAPTGDLTVTIDVATEDPSSTLYSPTMLDTPGLAMPDSIVVRAQGCESRHFTGADLRSATHSMVPAAEAILLEALRDTGALRDADPTLSYVEQGGRARDLIAVHYALADRGFPDIAPKSLLGPATLRQVAAAFGQWPACASR
ncbi:condensation domain-containing protein [Nocardia sp. NPDC050435]|uniref:condensation domain-containing protein n=1 Tax=Nocardia sp. NPDC050435 TaxID=3155040 RepID=UPI0033C0264C